MKKETKINIIKPFEKWFYNSKRLKIAYGGRGGGKSESIAAMLIVKSFEIEGTILCVRETNTSIEHSVYSLLIGIIEKNGLSGFFSVTKNEIVNKKTKTNFIFSGLLEYNITSVKSIYNVKICWIEEGENISQRSYIVLEPSIRAKESEIWVSFNPRRQSDVFYSIVQNYALTEKTFWQNGRAYKYSEAEDENTLILNVCFYSNPYFGGVLEKSRLMTLGQNKNLYTHIWLGQIKKEEGKIFLRRKLKTYNYENMKYELNALLKKSCVDPAFGEKSCYSCAVIYVQKDGFIYLLDAGLLRADKNRTSDEVIENFLSENKVSHVLCEANFSQKELVKKLRRSFDVTPFYSRENKIERIVNASIVIYERVFFPSSWFVSKDEIATYETKEGRGRIAISQLMNFSDIGSENCVKGSEHTYIDFPDCLASLVMNVKYFFNEEDEKKTSFDKIAQIFSDND